MAPGAGRTRLHRRSALAAASLDHPFICKVFEIGEADDQLFIVMEFVEGETLHEALRRGPLTSTTLVALALELVDALDAAHQRLSRGRRGQSSALWPGESSANPDVKVR